MATLVASPLNSAFITPSISNFNSAISTIVSIPEPDTKRRLSFLDFPPEVRNEIYTYLFRDSKLGISTVHTTTPLGNSRNNQVLTANQPRRPSCGSFCSCFFPWGIIYSCRLLRHETTSLLLSATTLEVTSRLEKTLLLPNAFTSSIRKIVILDARALVGLLSPRSSSPITSTAADQTTPTTPVNPPTAPHQPFTFSCFPSLRVLKLRNIRVWCKYYQESYLESPAADECMFNLAMFNLRRISPALVALCDNVDKHRAFQILLDCQFVGNSTRHETVQAMIDVDSKKVLGKSRGASGVGSRNAWAGFY